MSDDVISLSSEDEFEGLPPKRLKPANIENDVFKKCMFIINNLKEINLKKCEDTEIVIKSSEDNNLTIIIADDRTSRENQNNVVNLTEDSFEEKINGESNTRTECFIVDSDEERSDTNETKEDVVPKVEQNGHDIEIDILNRPSTSKASDAHKLLDEFLETCVNSMKGSKYECKVLPKFQNMKKNFDKCTNIHNEPNFKRMLQEYAATARISAPEAVVSFQRIYAYLLDNINGTGIEVSSEELLKLRKLEKTCKVLMKKLKKLEEAELNFDDEEDSYYIQIDRYSHRLTKVYSKYCQLLKRNPRAGRLIYERINFVSSKYNEINRAITKYYNKENKFPSYNDIEKCIRKCVSKNDLNLPDAEIKEHSEFCFKRLGKLLQMRRKKELYEVHCSYIAMNEDPATKDEDLKDKLQENLQEGEKKLQEVVAKFVRMQENNVTVDLSEDSDDSNYEDSDSEGEDATLAK